MPASSIPQNHVLSFPPGELLLQLLKMTTGFIDWVWINQVLQRFRAKSPRTIFKPTLNTAVPSILVVAFILIIWAAVRYGEQTPNSDNVLCEPRAQEVGFIGDPDFYGLGIRLGLYLQWIAYLITAASLPKERRGVMVSYVIFNLSITVAIMVKVFSRECTLTVELFVVLVLFWGGINVVHIPLMQATFFNGLRKRFQEPQASRSNIIRAASWMTEASGKTSPIEPRIPRTSRWLLLISHLFNFLISPITIWYWTRLAVAGQTDFAPTPGGSAFFFFARIPESSFKSFSIFMAIASTMTFIKLVQAFLPTPYDFEENPKLSGLVWILLGIITSPLGFIMFFLRIIPMLLASGMSALYYWTHQDGDAFDDGDLRYPGISPLPGDIFVLIGYAFANTFRFKAHI